MALKKKQKLGASSSADFDNYRFWNEVAANHYTSLVTKNMVRERGFHTCSTMKDVNRAARARGWSEFVNPPPDAVTSLVREFYANLKVKHEGFKVWVRGRRVAFDGYTINNIYNMPTYEEDEYSAYIAADQLDYNEIILRLCEEGAQWKLKDNDVVNFPTGRMKQDERSWFLFVAARVMPSSHTSDVTKKRAALTYSIVTGKTINLGNIIQDSILEAVKGTTTIGLPHPSLITVLCQHAGVTWSRDEELFKIQGPITGIFREKVPAPPRVTASHDIPASSHQTPLQPPPPPGAHMTDSERMARLEQQMLYQQQQMALQQQQQMAGHFRQAATFMSYMTDFTTVLARHFPGSSSNDLQFPLPPPPRPAHMSMPERLSLLEREVRVQRQEMTAFRHRSDVFMDFMMDFTYVLAQRFPATTSSDAPFPPHPAWPPQYPPPPADPEDADAGYDH